MTAYNGGEAAIDRERFINARAEDIKIEWKDDVAYLGEMAKAAWFKDSEGNTLCLDDGLPEA